jgi:hypothetical protein
MILPISASQVARITGVSHQRPAHWFCFLLFVFVFAVLEFEQKAGGGNVFKNNLLKPSSSG